MNIAAYKASIQSLLFSPKILIKKAIRKPSSETADYLFSACNNHVIYSVYTLAFATYTKQD